MRTPATIAPPPSLQDVLERNASIVRRHASEFLAPMFARRDALLAVVAQEFQVSPDELTGGLTTYAALPARRVAVALACELLSPPFTRDVIAGWFNVSDATLYRFTRNVREREAQEPSFAQRMNSLRERGREAIRLTGRQDFAADGSHSPLTPALSPLRGEGEYKAEDKSNG